jgi:hypothetical protein
MVTFFVFFVPVALLTVASGGAAGPVARQRDELLPLLNFEPFVYLLFVIAGASIFVSFRSQWAEKFGSLIIVPFAGALTGWGFGLTVLVLFRGEWRAALAGLGLTVFVAAFTLAPVFLVRRASVLGREVLGRLFPNRMHVLTIYALALALFTAGVAGLWGLYVG